MAADKATLIVRGKRLWQIQLELLRQLNPTQIFVSARTDPEWRPHDVTFVGDISPSRGPLSGLAASLQQIRTTHLLALAIDMPSMTAAYLKLLDVQIEPGCGVVPKVADRAEPLAAIYPREAASEFHAALEGEDFSLQSLVRNLVAAGKLQEISVTQQQKKLFLNINHPRDVPTD
jgi:molybdopterin-guanine dinucleotide biosynthesis protein A